MSRRAISVGLISLVLLALLPHPGGSAGRPSLIAYRGLGTWVDIYDDALWRNPDATAASIASHGVRTIYVETSNYKASRDIVYPDKIGTFIDAAHARGMRIVAWYLPSFATLDRDFRRSMAAIDEQTATGGRFDSFGLDIEAAVVSDPNARTQRALQLSSRIRSAVGPSYPLSAIIISPSAMRDYPDRWPGFPYQGLTQYYDVFQPMSYFSYRTSGAAGAHKYIADNIAIIRKRTGDPTIPIHVIGGIADATNAAEDRGMVHAARERGILGASLYDFATSGSDDWGEMAKVPVNPVERPALPRSLPSGRAMGNIPGGDQTHPKEVFYRVSGFAGAATLSFQAFGVQAGEVSLFVNWRKIGELTPTGDAWSETRTATIPASLLRGSSTNYIAFTAVGSFPHWSVWGVRQVSLSPA